MSRTQIYAKMEEASIILIGSNAYTTDSFSNFGDGFGFCKAGDQVSDVIKDQITFDPKLTELDIASLFDSTNALLLNDVNNVNSNDFLDTSLFEKDYSLDEIIDDAGEFSGSETMSPYMGTPVPSPLSPSLDLGLEGLLSKSNEIPTQFNEELSEIAEDDINYLLQADDKIVTSDMNLGSPDSGFVSSDELTSTCANDLVFQLFGGNVALNTQIDTEDTNDSNNMLGDPLNDILRKLIEPEETNEDVYEEEPTKRSSERPHPYKRKVKTEEQKQRKKAQNRNAAIRYRSKKKDELKIMLDEEDKLIEKNSELKSKVQGLRKEVDYLKNLMLDVIKARLAKGQKNPISLESLLQSNLIQS